jgi:hypothetical protein
MPGCPPPQLPAATQPTETRSDEAITEDCGRRGAVKEPAGSLEAHACQGLRSHARSSPTMQLHNNVAGSMLISTTSCAGSGKA